jgi:outer membrane protein TolC
MRNGIGYCVLSATLAVCHLVTAGTARSVAQEKPEALAPPAHTPPAVMRITLDEAKQRALANNKLINLGTLNAESKVFAVKAARANYFPQIIGSEYYLHFSDPLGTVITIKSRPLLGLPGSTIAANVINQNTSVASVFAAQPLTDLLKVRQGVKIAQADHDIAQAELQAGIRKLVSGVEQLYWGLLAARRIRAGTVEAVAGAEMLAKTGNLEARSALVEARQGLQAVDKEIADLQEQMNGLLDLPLCTTLELVEPALPVVPYRCADEVVGLALASNPDIHQAEATVRKAQAALCAGKLDYVPSVAVVGGFLNQTAANYIQPDIGYVGVVGTYTFVDWGKRRNVIRERQNLVAMANLKLQQTEDDVRQKAVKLFRELGQAQETLKTAQELVAVRKEIVQKATTPAAMRNPEALITASTKSLEADIAAMKVELAYRQAYIELMALIGQP